MYSNELVYFYLLHETNVKTEERPSIYPCRSFPLSLLPPLSFLSLLSFPLFPFFVFFSPFPIFFKFVTNM